MNDFIILLKARVWGCKIKSNIQGKLNLEKGQIKQGENLNLKLQVNFDPEDLPKSLEITQEDKPSPGFILKSPIRYEVNEPNIEVNIPLNYSEGKTGDYRIDVNFRHAEYGTQLADISPVTLNLRTPEIVIAYCRSDIQRLSKGQEFKVYVGFNSPAPQKIRGIVYGRLVSTSKMIHNMYELEPKRISIVGEKEIVWHVIIPHDETKTGKLKAIIEFKSKDTFSKKEFDGFIEIRQTKSLRVNKLESAMAYVSPEDELELMAEIENVGLEEIGFKVHLEIMSKNGNQHWILPTKTQTLAPDSKQLLKWSWKLPSELAFDKYFVNLHWKEPITNYSDTISQELFEVKRHHEVKILDAIVSNDSFSVDSDVNVKIMLSNTGTRARERLEIDWSIFDILNQEIYKKNSQFQFDTEVAEFDLHWPVPANLDGGKYDLLVSIKRDDTELVKRKFPKIINIELPTKLDINLMLPVVSKTDPEISKYLLETEEIVEKIKHRDLAIYQLNSNTCLYLINNELINYSIDNKSKPEQLQLFSDYLHSYIITREYLNPTKIHAEMEFWVPLGFAWSNFLLQNRRFLKIKEFKITKDRNWKPTLADLETITRSIFRDAFNQNQSLRSSESESTVKAFKLNRIFHQAVLGNKSITNTDDFKFLTSFLKYLAEYPSTTATKQTKVEKKQDVKLKNRNIYYLIELNEILTSAINVQNNVIPAILQKKFNRLVSDWLIKIRKEGIKRSPNQDIFQALRAGYCYILLYIISEITSILKQTKENKSIKPYKFNRFILLEMVYYFIVMNYYKTQASFDQYINHEEINNELNPALNEIRKIGQIYWHYQNRFDLKYRNYLKNMSKRANLAYIREHIKITTNPMILRGMRGGQGKAKLLLGNNGSRAIGLYPYLALPTIHWNLVEPEANTINEVYRLRRIIIAPKQTKEIPITISFPQSLTFSNYSGLIKLNPKPIKLLSEIY